MQRYVSIKSVLKELYEQEQASTSEEEPKVEFPTWLETKIKDVHGKPGQGSIFADPDSVKDIVLQTITDNSNISEIASTTGALKTNVSGIGYDLVLPIEEAQNLADAQVEETEKVEGPNRINVPMVRTSAPMSEFATDELTIIVRPKKDQTGAIIPNEYIILSAFPGKDLPRASEWNGKYAVIVPGQNEFDGSPAPAPLQERFTPARRQGVNMKKNNSQKSLLKESWRSYSNDPYMWTAEEHEEADRQNREIEDRIRADEAERRATRQREEEEYRQRKAQELAAERQAADALQAARNEIKSILRYMKDPDNQGEAEQNELRDLLAQATEKMPTIQKLSNEIKALEERAKNATGVDKYAVREQMRAAQRAKEAKSAELHKVLAEIDNIAREAATVSENLKIKRWQRLAGIIKG